MRIARSKRTVWLALLLLAASARADDAIRVTLYGDAPIRTGSVEVPGLGTLKLRAKQQGPLVWIEARSADGALQGRAQSVAGVRETPLSVRSGSGTQRLIVVIEGAQ